MSTNYDSNREPASLDDLARFIAQAAVDHHQRTGKGLNGSLLAHLVRREYPGLNYTKLGIAKLGDAVARAAQRNLVCRNPNVAHLEVSPPSPRPELPPANVPEKPVGQLLYVRSDIWRAVVFVSRSSIAFFNRLTKEITEVNNGDTARLQLLRADQSLVEIERVDSSTQLKWLKEFLQRRGELNNDSEEYLLSLIRGHIRDLGPEISNDWKYERSRKVAEHVKRWAVSNGIPEDYALAPADPDAKVRKRSINNTTTDVDQEKIRRAIMAAIEEMPLSDLQNLMPSLRYFLHHFSPK